jgi:ParB family chromosome partitioning protein
MVSNKKLGKGLSSLLGNKADLNLENKKDNGLLLIPIEKIFRDENQPRKEFDKEKIEELAQSIIKNGLIQPLILTKNDNDNYTLVAGERRWRAAQIANLKILPSLLLPTDLDKDEIALIENIQRENLKVTEEAQAYQKLIDKNSYTHDQLSKIVGKSRSHITNLLRILNLHEYFSDLLNKGIISMGHARALVGKKPEDLDEKLLLQINIGKASVRDIENNYSKKKINEPNLIQEEINLSQTIGFKTKITYAKSGKGNIKIFYNNLEQYNFLISKLKN